MYTNVMMIKSKRMSYLNLAISYFYQIRFFESYMIPISTAVYDPKWYHDFKGQDHVFLDKRNVVNGIRIHPLVPGPTCSNLCQGMDACTSGNPAACDFLHKYGKQLDSINFDVFCRMLEYRMKKLALRLGLQRDPLLVFIVYEAPDKKCSERGTILNWLHKNGVDIDELHYPIAGNY